MASGGFIDVTLARPDYGGPKMEMWLKKPQLETENWKLEMKTKMKMKDVADGDRQFRKSLMDF